MCKATDSPALRRRSRRSTSYTTNLSPQGHYVTLCPACNTAAPVPPTAVLSRVLYRRMVCEMCGVALTVKVPPFGKRVRWARQCPPDECHSGTRGAVLVPAISAAQALPKRRTVRNASYLRTHLIEQGRDEQRTLSRVRQLPLAEQMGMAVRLGLPLDVAVLSVLASEEHWLFAHHPRLGVIEQVIAMLVSVALPVEAREKPARWAFDTYRNAHRYTVLFPQQRTYFTWARIRPLPRDLEPYAADYAAMLRAVAKRMEPFRPWVLRNIRVIRACDWSLHVPFTPDTVSPTWACWQTCCGDVRLDTTDAYLRNHEGYIMPVHINR